MSSDPREKFLEGKRTMKKVLSLSGEAEGERFLLRARALWRSSKKFSDKKFYDGAKKVLDSYTGKSQSVVDESTAPSSRIIRHAWVSNTMKKSFGADFLEKYGLVDIETVAYPFPRPCVYFGCYGGRDVNAIKWNSSDFKVVLYGGTDAMNSRRLKSLKREKGLYHAAISNYISDDLCSVGIDHKVVPITPVDHSKQVGLTLEPLGRDIYVYTAPGKRADFYGKPLYLALQRLFPNIKFHICTYATHSRAQLNQVYKSCFMGLRLVPHDGLPNTVIELGLMGRRTVHNGGLPSGIAWSGGVSAIADIIKEEQSRVGRIFPEVRRDTEIYLNNTRDWLQRDFWE